MYVSSTMYSREGLMTPDRKAFTLRRLQDIKDILNKTGCDLDPSKTRVYVGRIEDARQDIYDAILIINDIFKYNQREPWYKKLWSKINGWNVF